MSGASETPAERIARKDREAKLRQLNRDREQLWCDLWAHVHGIMLIAAMLDLGYKPNFKKEK
jgi:hypothetical protein